MQTQANRPKIVIVGGGFGGLAAIRELKGVEADITLIDKRNHHLFQPLLYQVATTSLGPSEIAWPIRQLVHKRHEVTTLLGTVTGVDAERNLVHIEGQPDVPFDYLILATGARHAYFGHTSGKASRSASRKSRTRPASGGRSCCRSNSPRIPETQWRDGGY